MKFSIMQKLLTVVALPIATLLIFSINHFNTSSTTLEIDKMDLVSMRLMQTSSDFVHELQIERGLSASYLNKIDAQYFFILLEKQITETDKQLKNFLEVISSINRTNLSVNTLKYIMDIKPTLSSLSNIRDLIQMNQIAPEKSFHYFTLLNNQLILILNGLKLQTLSQEANSNIVILNKVIQLQEFAGQERALVAKFSSAGELEEEDLRYFHNLIAVQKDNYTQINFLLENTDLIDELRNVHQKYAQNMFNKIRETVINEEHKKHLINDVYKILGYGGMIHDLLRYSQNKDKNLYLKYLNKQVIFSKYMNIYISLTSEGTQEYATANRLLHSFDNVTRKSNLVVDKMKILSLYNYLAKHLITLDSKIWFDVSTSRINEIHTLESKLFHKINKAVKENIKQNNDTLRNQILLTLGTILFLLIGTFYIANKIKYSVAQLELGIDNFFKFLNGEIEKPQNIDTGSNDEINTMAQNINQQILLIEENLEEDKDFINEATQIVTLMKEGDFSERPYFEPHDPNLLELKSVLDELMELISDKIKEQTDSLEELNRSLEERVHQQTIELENQIKEITLSRDKAIQAEIAKDEFLANMSHEIRTPLNAILGFVTILKKQIKEEKPLNYLNIIDTSGKSLLTIINDILDFSKIQSGKFIISPYEVNPVEEFSNAALLFASKAYEKHLIYTVYIDPNLPQSISVDAVRVKQIFSNILSNAIKFTPDDGEIRVNVICEASQLIIKIEDTGIGIAEKNIAKVFSAFEQADGSTTRKYGGTGLGLSISHRLAQLMDDELSLTSIEGEGSTFTLKLPIEITNQEPKPLIDATKLSNYSVALLSLDTSSYKLQLIKQYLQDFGVTNIQELQEFQEDGYDLLFFIPDDEYNEDIVYSKKPSIALLRSSTIKLANLDHIEALYAPYTPANIVQAINDSGIDKIIEHKKVDIEDEEETQFIGSILVAEDNKTNQMLISLILDDYGLEYAIANNGIEAVDMFKKEKYDLVLMDENMPELNGIGAMQQIKEYENNKSLIMTPILALTASVLDTDKEMFLNAGMDGFVGKPIDNNELESELSRFLKKA